MKNSVLPSVPSQLFLHEGNGIEQVIAIPVRADIQLYQNTYGNNKGSLSMDPSVEYKSGIDYNFYEQRHIDGSFYIPFQSSSNVYQPQQPGPSSSLTTAKRQDQFYSGEGGSQISTLSSIDNNMPHQQLLSFCNNIAQSTVLNNSNTDAQTRKQPIIRKRGLCNGDEIEGGSLSKKKRALFTAEMGQCLDGFCQADKHQFMKKTIQTQRKSVQVRSRSNKLSDKITALQKLVSPYGKTDTASVLQEASISIKLLQHQIQIMLRKKTASSNAKPLNLQLTELTSLTNGSAWFRYHLLKGSPGMKKPGRDDPLDAQG